MTAWELGSGRARVVVYLLLVADLALIAVLVA